MNTAYGEGGPVIVVRTLTVDDWAEWRALWLAALADAPDAWRTTLAEWQDAGEPRWRARLAARPLHLIADLDGRPAGLVSGTLPDRDGTAELHSMWVAPFARGRGVADELIRAVLRWAAEHRAGRVSLQVMPGNRPAIALYERHGFADTGEPTVIEGSLERVMIREPGDG